MVASKESTFLSLEGHDCLQRTIEQRERPQNMAPHTVVYGLPIAIWQNTQYPEYPKYSGHFHSE